MSVLDSLTKEQRNTLRDLIMDGYVKGWHDKKEGAIFSAVDAAFDIFPEPLPVMVPLTDVLPVIEALRLHGGRLGEDAAIAFRQKHSDKIKALGL